MNTDDRRPTGACTDAGALADAHPPSTAGSGEPIIAGLLYLLVRTTVQGACMHQVKAVSHHLELLQAQAGTGPVLRDACRKLHDYWLRSAAAREAERLASAVTVDRSVH